MSTGPELAPALVALRDAVAATRFDLAGEGAVEAEEARDAVVHQVDDYLLPRLRSLDAPVLAVVGGSTGAGKSTLVNSLLREEARAQGLVQRNRLLALGAPEDLAHRIVQLSELNGAIGIASLAQEMGTDPIQLTRAYTKLGEALALDWAQAAANRFAARDQWERLLTAGLARDFEQLRLEFLERCSGNDPKAAVDRWVAAQGARIDQFRRLVDRARTAPITTAPMLAQIATQARVLLGR